MTDKPRRDPVQVLPSGEQSAREMGQFRRDVEYFGALLSTLQKEHTAEWVAIFNQRIIAIAPTLAEATAALRAEGLPISRAILQQIWAAEIPWGLG